MSFIVSTMYISTGYKYIIQVRKNKVPLRDKGYILLTTFMLEKKGQMVLPFDLFKICTQLQVSSSEMYITIL